MPYYNREYVENVICRVTTLDPRVPQKLYYAQQLLEVSTEGVDGTRDIQEVIATFPLGEFHPENGAIGICMMKGMRQRELKDPQTNKATLRNKESQDFYRSANLENFSLALPVV